MDRNTLEYVASGMRGSKFIRDAAANLVLLRRSQGCRPLDTPQAAAGAVLLCCERLLRRMADNPAVPLPGYREPLLDLLLTAWRAALDLGLASAGDEPPELPDAPAPPSDHEALDLLHTILDVKGWEPRREPARVVFVDHDARECEAIVRVLCADEDDDEPEDDDRVESEGEVIPLRPFQRWASNDGSGHYAWIRAVSDAGVTYRVFGRDCNDVDPLEDGRPPTRFTTIATFRAAFPVPMNGGSADVRPPADEFIPRREPPLVLRRQDLPTRETGRGAID